MTGDPGGIRPWFTRSRARPGGSRIGSKPGFGWSSVRSQRMAAPVAWRTLKRFRWRAESGPVIAGSQSGDPRHGWKEISAPRGSYHVPAGGSGRWREVRYPMRTPGTWLIASRSASPDTSFGHDGNIAGDQSRGHPVAVMPSPEHASSRHCASAGGLLRPGLLRLGSTRQPGSLSVSTGQEVWPRPLCAVAGLGFRRFSPECASGHWHPASSR